VAEDFLDFEVPDSTDESWQIANDNEAEWCVMKIAEAQSTLAHHEAERAKAIEKWDRYVESATREAQRAQAFFEAKLQGFLLALRKQGKLGNKKSYRLPSAMLQLRNVPANYDVAAGQKDAFLAWCEAHGLTEIKVVEKWAEAKQCFSATEDGHVEAINRQTGEVICNVVPGVIVIRPEYESFSVMFPKDEKPGERKG
jgi:hypothetical protein